MGVDALVESVRRIREGTATKIPQDETLATYEPPCNDAVANIEWSLPGQKLFNLVRGCDPQPGAFSFWKGEKIRFYEARLLSEPTALSPGQVASVNPHLQIAILGGRIQIERLRIASGEKLSATDFVAARDVKAGDVFRADVACYEAGGPPGVSRDGRSATAPGVTLPSGTEGKDRNDD